jgi:hypothetical protein
VSDCTWCQNLSNLTVPWCVGLDRFWHHVQSDTFPWSLGVLDYTDSDIMYNLTHFLGHQATRKKCLIVHDVRTGLIWHTTPRDQGNVSDCTWCQNLSNPIHQGTRKMCQIVTGSDIMYNLTHFPGPLVCRIRQILTSCTIRHIFLVPWCVSQIVHDVRICLIWHTKGPGKCVWLYMISEPV